MHGWPLVALGDILTPSIDRHPVEAGKLYPNIGIYGFGRGVFEKPPIDGGSTSASALYRVKAGQLIYSRLFAFEGAYALVPDFADGAYVSNEYPAFEIDAERVVPEFIGWLFRLPRLWESLAALTSGMGDRRRRLHPERLLTYQVHLPPQSDQRAIVADLDAVAARIAEVQRLRREVHDDLGALLVAMPHRSDREAAKKQKDRWQHIALGEILQQSSDSVAVNPGVTYPHFGIYSFAKGLFPKAPIAGDEIKATRLYRVSEGQFMYGRLNAYDGAFGIVGRAFNGAYVSSEFPAFDCDSSRVLPEFLMAYFSAPAVWETLKRHVTGIGGGAGNRRIRLKESVFLAHCLWLPPLDYQLRVKSVALKLHEFKVLREETDAELNALLPSVLDKAFKDEL